MRDFFEEWFNMKLKDVINGDFRNESTKQEAQNWLLKIEPLRKRTPVGENVKFEDIEQLIIKISKKYKIMMQWISFTMLEGEVPWYSVSVKDGQTHEWLKTLYGISVYELYVKVALFMFATTRERDRNKDG